MVGTEAELEEERRLLYVAMTRARDRLYITFPLRYYHRKHPLGDSHSFAQLTRFLPPDHFPLFERIGRSDGDADMIIESNTPKDVPGSVQARLERLWE
jgi:DNA helicase II / ATP-dependent DNA helicase PcrA